MSLLAASATSGVLMMLLIMVWELQHLVQGFMVFPFCVLSNEALMVIGWRWWRGDIMS